MKTETGLKIEAELKQIEAEKKAKTTAPANLEKRAQAFRENFWPNGSIRVNELKERLLTQLAWAKENPPDFTTYEHPPEMRKSLRVRDKQIWQAALAFVESLLQDKEQPK